MENKKLMGREGESAAAAYLKKKRYKVIGMNYACRFGEIDLICEKKTDVCGGLARTHFFIRWPVLLLLILAIVVFGVYGSGYDGAAFLYTQF